MKNQSTKLATFAAAAMVAFAAPADAANIGRNVRPVATFFSPIVNVSTRIPNYVRSY
jgi:hypothetical protein